MPARSLVHVEMGKSITERESEQVRARVLEFLEVSPVPLTTQAVVSRTTLALTIATKTKVISALTDLERSGKVVRLGDKEWFASKHLSSDGEFASL